MTTELQFAVIKDELTAMVDDIIRQFLNDKDYDQNQAQSWCNGSSKKETLHFISALLAYGIPILMDLSLSNMKMTNYTASSAYSVSLHK